MENPKGRGKAVCLLFIVAGWKPAEARRLASLQRTVVESFLRSSPSWPQAFARFYGTIRTGSATGLYFDNSKDRPVEESAQSFPGPKEIWGKQSVNGVKCAVDRALAGSREVAGDLRSCWSAQRQSAEIGCSVLAR